MGSPTAGEEEYLETLYWLHEVQLPLTAANVSRAMLLSAPTVHEMVKRLEADGLISRDERKRISFTERGLGVAENVVSRHRLVERFLTDVLNIPWHEVHEEAERMEHAMSPQIEAGMRAAIGTATTCPHGHPIEVGKRIPGAPLADVEIGATITVLRFENEAEQVLHYLYGAGVQPGLQGTVTERGEEHVAFEDTAGVTHALTISAAETVSVKADPSPPERVGLPRRSCWSRRPSDAEARRGVRRRTARPDAAPVRAQPFAASTASASRRTPSSILSAVTAE